MKLVDTNILLHYPSFIEENSDCVITIRTIEEIDNLKRNQNQEVAYQARRASYAILKNREFIKFYNKKKKKLAVDDELVYFAKKKKWTLITNDLNLQIKCRFNKVKYNPYSKDKGDYIGVEYGSLSLDENRYNEVLENMLENKKSPIELKENQFLIATERGEFITDRFGHMRENPLAAFIYKNEELSYVEPQVIKNKYCGKITPRNIEQQCLMRLLKDEDISIVLAAGGYGTGKSFLLINYALQELERGNINKIVYVPNNSIVDNAREVGLLPGTMFEKESLYMGTIMDMVGAMFVEELVQKEQIEVAPMATIRGRNFDKSIIIVNEAQNLTEDHIKLLIARVGEGSKIFFDGDIKQTDSHIFKNKNGLRLLLNLKDSKTFGKIFGTVKLLNIERSLTAQASAYLDNLA